MKVRIVKSTGGLCWVHTCPTASLCKHEVRKAQQLPGNPLSTAKKN